MRRTTQARILGKQSRIGRVRAGWLADLIVVNGNPLENLKVLHPCGVERTVKDGIPYHRPTLLKKMGGDRNPGWEGA